MTATDSKPAALSLYHVQDPDRPMYVVATSLADAVARYTAQVRCENDGDPCDPPQGVAHVCDASELLLGEPADNLLAPKDAPAGDAKLRELREFCVRQAAEWSAAAARYRQNSAHECYAQGVAHGFRTCRDVADERLLAAATDQAEAVVEPATVTQRTSTDCMRACVATYFSVPYEEVPDLSQGDWMLALRDWLAPRGLGFFSADINGNALQTFAGRGTFIVAGKSPRGVKHAVVYRDGQLWHDPHPEGGGIDNPTEIDLFVSLGTSEVRKADLRAKLNEKAIDWTTRGGMRVVFPREHVETGIAVMTQEVDDLRAEVESLRGMLENVNPAAMDEVSRERDEAIAEIKRRTRVFALLDQITAGDMKPNGNEPEDVQQIVERFVVLTKERDELLARPKPSAAAVHALCDRIVRWIETGGRSDPLTLSELKDRMVELVEGTGAPIGGGRDG